MDFKIKIVLWAIIFFIVYNAINFILLGKPDIFIGLSVALIMSAYLWHINKKAEKK